MIRTAISPRFATNTFLNMTPPNGERQASGLTCQVAPETWNLIPDTLERNIPVFLCGVGIALVAEHLECIDQARAGLFGLDNIVNITAFRRNVGAGKFPAV